MGSCFSSKQHQKRLEDPAKEVVLLNHNGDITEVGAVIGRSFSGTVKTDPEWSIHWALGPELSDFEDPRRLELVTTIMTKFVAAPWIKQGLCYGAYYEGKLAAVNLSGRFSNAKDAALENCAALSTMCLTGCSIACSCYCGNPKRYFPLLGKDKDFMKNIRPKMNKRFELADKAMKDFHKMYASGPHWYTFIMATDPSAQGKSLCGKLMRFITREADADGLPCYLETSGLRNTKIYARFGYEVVGQKTLEYEGHRFEDFFAMVRPAAATTSKAPAAPVTPTTTDDPTTPTSPTDWGRTR